MPRKPTAAVAQPSHPEAAAADHVIKAAVAGAKVTVACKIGVGWFDLQLCEKRIVKENTQTGPRDIEQWFRLPRIVRIRGTAYPRGTPPEGYPERPEMVGGFALTRNVDKDFWDEWEKQNSRSPFVQNKMIFAYESNDAVVGQAKELAETLSGLEPLNPKKDSRMPKPTNTGITEIQEGRR